jgi:DnaK suppressor protein
MDADQARQRLLTEQAEATKLLLDTRGAGHQDRASEDDAATGDYADAAQPLTAQGEDDAIAETLGNRLEQIARALQRIEDGTWGRSVRSGQPIPAGRLEADPAAELTVEEAAADEAAR